MTGNADREACRSLRPILASLPIGAAIEDSPEFRSALSALEFFIPAVLQELYAEWEYESLDGIYPLVARKTNDGEAEVFGQCILISDQTLTPIHVILQTSMSGDSISWLELRLGERSDNGMVRTPYNSPSHRIKRVYSLLEEGLEAIDWVYKVSFGDRRG